MASARASVKVSAGPITMTSDGPCSGLTRLRSAPRGRVVPADRMSHRPGMRACVLGGRGLLRHRAAVAQPWPTGAPPQRPRSGGPLGQFPSSQRRARLRVEEVQLAPCRPRARPSSPSENGERASIRAVNSARVSSASSVPSSSPCTSAAARTASVVDPRRVDREDHVRLGAEVLDHARHDRHPRQLLGRPRGDRSKSVGRIPRITWRALAGARRGCRQRQRVAGERDGAVGDASPRRGSSPASR